MRALFFVILLNFSIFPLTAQDLSGFSRLSDNQHKLEKRSMLALSAWGGTNLIVGTVGWSTASGEAKYFHQMNAGWGLINMGIGLGALLRKNNRAENSSDFLRRAHRTEKVLLLNTGLDVAYITGGFLLRSMSKNNPENVERFRGFGNSLLLQGGFLLVFDITQTILNQKLRKKLIQSDVGSLSLNTRGIGLVYTFN